MDLLAEGKVGDMATTADAEGSFDDLFRAEFPSIARTAYLIVGDREKATEIAQEAFTRMFVSWKRVSRHDRPGAWVRRVAIRMATREARRSRLLGTALRSMSPPRTPTSTNLDLRTALMGLPKSQRAAVVLHYLEDRPIKEVAELLECAEATAKVHLHRARKRLAQVLGEEITNDS